MPKEIAYRISATATGGGRDGRARTEDGALDVQMVVPKDMGGPGGDGVNPEQLFATGYAACFLGALRAHAGQKKVQVPQETSVTASVGIGPRADTGFALDVGIRVSLPGLDRDVAEDLIAGAHLICPYSDAARNGFRVTPELA